MANYRIGITDEASTVAAKIRKSVSAIREEMRAVGEVRMPSGQRLSTTLKATALHAAARWGSEKLAETAIRATSRANRQAARAADIRAHAERRAGTAVMRSVRAERELARLRGHGPGGAAAGVGGAGRGGRGGRGGAGAGGYAPTTGRDPWMTGLAVAGGGLAAAGVGIGAFYGAQMAISGIGLAAGAVTGVLRGLANALMTAARAAGVVAWEFGKATVAAFDFRSRASTAFQALVGDGEGGFERLKKTALEMRMSLGDTFDGIRAMLAAGFKESDATRLFKRLQDLKGIGITQEVLGRVTLAIAQIKGAGTLQGDELRQLMETGLDIELVWKSISKQMGVSIEKAKKLKEQGKVTAKVAIQAIEETISQKTGGRAAGDLGKEMAEKTFTGFRNTMGLIRELVFDRVVKGVGGQGISELLVSMNEAADNIFKWMEGDDAAVMFTEIGYAVKGVAGDFKTLVESPLTKRFVSDLKDIGMWAFRIAKAWWDLGKVFVAGFMGKGAMELGGIKDAMADTLKLLKSDAAKSFFLKLGETVRWSVDNLIKFSAWVNQALGDDLNEAGSGLKQVTTTIGSSFGEGLVYGVMSGISTLASEMMNAGVSAATSLIDGLVGGLLGGIPKISGITTTLGDVMKRALKGEIHAHSPSRDFELIGASAPEGAARGIASNDNARAAAETMGREVKRAAVAGMQAPTVGTAAKAAAAEGLIGPNYGAPVAAGGGGLPPGAVGGTHVHYHTTTIPITIQGDVTKDVADDLESRLLGLLERVA